MLKHFRYRFSVLRSCSMQYVGYFAAAVAPARRENSENERRFSELTALGQTAKVYGVSSKARLTLHPQVASIVTICSLRFTLAD